MAITSFRIAAPPNSVIQYAGEEYKTGPSGSIELVAEPAVTTVSVGNSVFNLPQSVFKGRERRIAVTRIDKPGLLSGEDLIDLFHRLVSKSRTGVDRR